MMLITRTSLFRWAGALFDQSLLKHWRTSRKTNTNSGEYLEIHRYSFEIHDRSNLADFSFFFFFRNSFMTDKIMPLSQAVEAYELFNAMKVQKVVFIADE